MTLKIFVRQAATVKMPEMMQNGYDNCRMRLDVVSYALVASCGGIPDLSEPGIANSTHNENDRHCTNERHSGGG